MDREMLKEIMEDILFAREAAEYLSISTQRLNQLVHSGQLEPIKSSNQGNLFLRQDLDTRKQELKSIGRDIKIQEKHASPDLDTEFLREAINYFVIQSFYNYSDKRTEPIFEELKWDVNITDDMDMIAGQISKRLDIPVNELLNSKRNVARAFKLLNEDDVILKKGMKEYPELLFKTNEAPPYIFARGNVDLLKERIVSVVGSRNASPEGIEKAYRLSKALGKYGIVVASGLARGIDTAAHTAAIDNNQMTIAVIGTPITKVYPKENEKLQKIISEKGLVISQFSPAASVQRWHFPMRNAVMSGISLATAIVEAGETSGALKQADYALKQGRIVFIPQSALENNNITWPKNYIKREGARSFTKVDELLKHLAESNIITNRNEQISLFTEGADNKNVHGIE